MLLSLQFVSLSLSVIACSGLSVQIDRPSHENLPAKMLARAVTDLFESEGELVVGKPLIAEKALQLRGARFQNLQRDLPVPPFLQLEEGDVTKRAPAVDSPDSPFLQSDES